MISWQTAVYVKFLHLTVNSSSTQNELEETRVEVDKKKEQKSSLKRWKHKLVVYDLENEGEKET